MVGSSERRSKRSSTAREFLGAVKSLDALREGKGDFETEEEFYRYWRKFNVSKTVQQQLDKLIAEQARPKSS